MKRYVNFRFILIGKKWSTRDSKYKGTVRVDIRVFQGVTAICER